MAKTVFDVLIEKIDEDKQSAQQFLGGGGAQDFAAYKEVVGVIRGLDSCRNHIEDLAKNYLESDDE